MGGAQTKRKRNSCLCGDSPIELRSLQMTSEMALLTPAGTKLARSCEIVPVIGPEIKDIKNSRSATGKVLTLETLRYLRLAVEPETLMSLQA